MALIDSEGFGFSTTAADYATYGRFIFQNGTTGNYNEPAVSIATNGPLGDNYMSYDSGPTYGAVGSGGRVLRPVPTPGPELFVGFRMNLVAATSNKVLGVAFMDASGNEQCSVLFNALGAAVLCQGNGSTVLASSAASVIAAGSWVYVEIGVTIGVSSGAMTVRVAGTAVASVSGANTQTGQFTAAGATTSSIAFTAFANEAAAEIAHFYVCDNTGPAPCNSFLGDVRVQCLLPVSNDAVAFTPNGLANNWQNAASVPPVPAADYNSGTAVGATDTFNTGTLSASLGVIYALNVKSLLSKSDAGARTAACVVKSGTTTAAATSANVGTSPAVVSGIFPTDPNTGGAWSNAAAAAAKVGYSITA